MRFCALTQEHCTTYCEAMTLATARIGPTMLQKTVFLSLLLVSGGVRGQQNAGIEEIIITAPASESRVSSPGFVLDSDAILEKQPVAVADIFESFTGVSMRSNSRGDSVVRIRGAEERQTLVFLDGAPLATPWDGRADLALLPAGLIDHIEVTRGVAPIEYGANAVAGAIDLVTFLPQDGITVRAEARGGSLGLRNMNVLAGIGLDNGWSFTAGGSIVDRDAVRIADKSAISFDPASNSSRTNTDLTGSTLYAATSYSGDASFLRASILHADVVRGVAAQGDIDPAVSRVRFWRTPLWKLTQATLNGHWHWDNGINFRATGWQQLFDQSIDSYSDYSYSTLLEREDGNDETIGARLSLSLPLDWATVRFVTTAQESTHTQTEFATLNGSADGLVADPSLRFRQRLTTSGIEADFSFGEDMTSTLGIGIDRTATPLTGDKPVQASLSATSWSLGLRWTPSDVWSAAATLGERSRFPTPRELFGVALGRFLLNPDLRPERSLLGDVSVEYSATDSMTFDVALWINDSNDTLSQRVVNVGGSSLRQRFNTNGSFTYGVEAALNISFLENLRAEISTSLQDGEVARDESGERPALLQRPKQQVSVAFDWQATPRLDMRAEVFHTGSAFDLADDGSIVTLPSATSLNLRGFYSVGEWRGHKLLLTAAIDNANDELILPQLGLPSPGRTFHVGIRIN